MNKNLKKFLIASVAVGSVNFLPINFYQNNFHIVSVAHAEIQNVVASDSVICDFGEEDEKISNTVKNLAKLRATQAAKEKAGIFVKSHSKTVNGIVTDDDISVYASNNIEIIDVTYKKIPIQAHDVQGNDIGKIGFAYEATVTAKIDTSGLSEYVERDELERDNLSEQNKNLQKNIFAINNEYEDLRKTYNNKSYNLIQRVMEKINNETLALEIAIEGEKLIEKNNYQDAILKYDQAIKLNPNLAGAYHNRGYIYSDLKIYDKALENYNKAIQLEPNVALSYSSRGTIYSKVKMYDKAISDYSKAIQLNPNFAMAYYNRGLSYLYLKQYKKTIADCDKAILIKPNYPTAYNNRGIAYALTKNFKKAVEDFTKSIELNPNIKNTYNNRGNAYRDLKQYDKAMIDFDKAIKLDPNDASAYNNRGCVYHDLKQYDKAIADFDKAIQLNPNYSGAYRNRGLSYEKLGNKSKADSDFKKAKELGNSRSRLS